MSLQTRGKEKKKAKIKRTVDEVEHACVRLSLAHLGIGRSVVRRASNPAFGAVNGQNSIGVGNTDLVWSCMTDMIKLAAPTTTGGRKAKSSPILTILPYLVCTAAKS